MVDATNGVLYEVVEYAQTVVGPLITGMAACPTFTEIVAVESQPRLFASVILTVPVPAVFHKTWMLLAVVEPDICPPVTDQLTEFPDTVCNEYVAVVYRHKEVAPVITGTGVG